jgi:hypothetical protein
MKNQNTLIKAGLCVGGLILTLAGGTARANPKDHYIVGESAEIGSGTAATWARVNGAGKVIWVGLTIPLSMVENQPPTGSGPAGAVVVLEFPLLVRQATYFDHVQIHSNRMGHPTNPGFADTHRYAAPHFDFHFYGIPEEEVEAIPFLPPFPPLPVVTADRLPAGYAQPEFSVPQMGRHSAPLSEFTATDTWQATILAGFLPDASYMHFIEPMITRDFLLSRKNFALQIPTPAILGRDTQFPTECVVQYDRNEDVCYIIYKGFQSIH